MTNAEMGDLDLSMELRLATRRLQLWRLCSNAKCRRACACRGEVRHCTLRFADWAEAVREVAQREFAARDPDTRALRAELETADHPVRAELDMRRPQSIAAPRVRCRKSGGEGRLVAAAKKDGGNAGLANIAGKAASTMPSRASCAALVWLCCGRAIDLIR